MKEFDLAHELTNGYEFVTGLKNFGPAGLEKLIKLEEIAFGGHGEDAYTLKMIDTVGFVMGALEPVGHTLVGAIEVVPVWKSAGGEKQAFIHGVLVHPDHQSQGLGSALIAGSVKKAFEEGYGSVAATISPANGPSLNAFLNKNVFSGTGFHKDFYGPGEHRFWVQKNLLKPGFGQEQFKVAAESVDELEDLIGQNKYQATGITLDGNGGHLIIISK